MLSIKTHDYTTYDQAIVVLGCTTLSVKIITLSTHFDIH